MWCLSKISVSAFVVLLLKGAIASDVSFQHVTVDLLFANNSGQNIDVKSSSNLKENLPHLNDGRVSSVTVSGSIPILYENSVSDLSVLGTLILSNVGLQEIKPGCFRNFHVETLDLTSNKLEEIRGGTFSEKVTFRNLKLDHNRLKKIQPGVLKSVQRFYSLSLTFNQFEDFDPKCFDHPDVDFVDLQFNSISTLRPGDLRNLPNLRTLLLSRNKLTEIPEGVFNNNYLLQKLEVNYNKIRKIAAKAFDNMTYFSELHMDHNKLAKWDNNWLRNTSNLGRIEAGHNLIEEIPDEAFKNYPELHTIDLRGNKIKNISPNALKSFKSMINFDLQDNLIDHWDKNVLESVSIGTVYLDNNKIKCIDGDLKTVFKTVYFVVTFWGNAWDPDCPVKTNYFDETSGSQPCSATTRFYCSTSGVDNPRFFNHIFAALCIMIAQPNLRNLLFY